LNVTKANRYALRICLVALVVCAGIGIFVASSVARAQATDSSAQRLDEGKKLFYARCGYCHLAGGTGTYMLGRRLGKDRALLETRTDLSAEYVRKKTRVGINTMPKHTRIEVPDSELDLIAAYIARPASARMDADRKTQSPDSKGGRP
jgi:mono/diheme cytochrome c family protein